jgi:hypothetical protein
MYGGAVCNVCNARTEDDTNPPEAYSPPPPPRYECGFASTPRLSTPTQRQILAATWVQDPSLTSLDIFCEPSRLCSVLVIVRYHCGGWSEEVNSCILIISYMVYL